MLKIIFIRHGKTFGNTLGRYIGTTDEPLCREGKEELKKNDYPSVDLVYASPMKRCLETAGEIYPDLKPHVEELLKECDFGLFENKNYLELSEYPEYQVWIDSNGTLPFPGGEDSGAFRKRCCKGFVKILEELPMQQEQVLEIALVVHGGTIMSILEAYGEPKKSFYDWQIKNGAYLTATLDETLWVQRKEVRLITRGIF